MGENRDSESTEVSAGGRQSVAEETFELLRLEQTKIQGAAPLSKSRCYQNQLDDLLNREYGFRNSFEKADSVDGDGSPIPWMTYSAIYYLKQFDLTDCDVFEWGCGNSTRFFADRAKSVYSVESNPEWYKHIYDQLPGNSTLSLEVSETYASRIGKLDQLFDVIVVDGDIFRRLECVVNALPCLKPGGLIVLDNSDWLQNTCRLLRDLGYQQIDFSGPGPINEYTWCTSIFHKGLVRLPSADFRPGYLKTGVKNVRDAGIANASLGQNLKTTGSDFEGIYRTIKGSYLPEFADVFSSQEGEDILIKRILKWFYKQPGFYVDVGAHHPVRFSNTYHYYLQGWTGINIDPLPGSKREFDRVRPRDTNLQVGVSSTAGQLDYHQFVEPAFNTFCAESAEYAKTRTELVSIDKVETTKLNDLLDRHLPNSQQIFFLNIDVEGSELAVLESSDWQKYRPYIICIEALVDSELQRIDAFLEEVGYSRKAGTKNSHIYCESSFWEKVK